MAPLAAWVTKDAGLLEKNGLDGRLIFFTGGSTAMFALISGDVPITQVSGPGLSGNLTKAASSIACIEGSS
jgi:ABC-type nitrate/sulfonate/bicarbonate transport system substrate-binding protein